MGSGLGSMTLERTEMLPRVSSAGEQDLKPQRRFTNEQVMSDLQSQVEFIFYERHGWY